MRLGDLDELKAKLQEHHDFFVNAYGGFKNLPPNDKARVDEIIHCISEIVNAPTIKTFTLLDIEEQYRKGLEKGLSEWETERPQGEWINHSLENLLWGHNECPFCHKRSNRDANFCQYCGADMRGNKE